MAKSKSRRRKSSGTGGLQWGGAYPEKKRRRGTVTWALVVVATTVAAGAYGWNWFTTARAFDALAASGQSALSRVQAIPAFGGGHLEPGETLLYDDRFPTSGRHDPIWATPGVYAEAQPATKLVHALEHGNIVIYYDEPGAEVFDTLRDWAGLYGGQWDGVVLTPAAGLGANLVLTAWAKRLDLSQWEPAAAAAFIDAYRGRGPEHPVR